jgi:Protein of unknown function (DUF2958)
MILTDAPFDRLLANTFAGDIATRFISEMVPDDPDHLFGLCDLGLELGYVSLAELTPLRGPLGLPVERDEHSSQRTSSPYQWRPLHPPLGAPSRQPR